MCVCVRARACACVRVRVCVCACACAWVCKMSHIETFVYYVCAALSHTHTSPSQEAERVWLKIQHYAAADASAMDSLIQPPSPRGPQASFYQRERGGEREGRERESERRGKEREKKWTPSFSRLLIVDLRHLLTYADVC